ncbi:peptide-methionine (S)-S-oxide reductase MsrA [Aquisalimonas sp.]|uniref:peptide-methionine (S)-S-oxide reductase MsrA n=1 Tax=Aquisalimonas sp. TaxID=1872621 RepID=UPI0025C655C6|nr:peptide-methionine (S)-S-oxide reductase MsrA [Aquisalimonas sp.]
MSKQLHTAVVGGGCFWCLEAVFQRLAGVHEVVSGYAGGQRANPTYQQVCSGATGHAEVVRIRFDPEVISFGKLLEVFFSIHDPTQLNRQGHDIGTQYRSTIMPQDAEQERIALEAIEWEDNSGVWRQPLVTAVEPGATFWPAETEHQDFFTRNTFQPYCQFVIAPKLKHAQATFPEQVTP